MPNIPQEFHEKILEFLRSVADPEQWGYFDDSGCARGYGDCLDSWVGDGDHPQEKARRLIALIQQH
jgi:hypothetical protein